MHRYIDISINKSKHTTGHIPDEEVEMMIPIIKRYLLGATSCIGLMLCRKVSRGKPADVVNITTIYVRMAVPTADNVPLPIALPGSFKSPERFAPSL
jgi:hypothetical protein